MVPLSRLLMRAARLHLDRGIVVKPNAEDAAGQMLLPVTAQQLALGVLDEDVVDGHGVPS